MTHKSAEVNAETQELLKRVYQIKEGIQFETREDIVFIIKEQNAKIQRGLRKIGFKIPKKSEMELDKYGSFIFLQIDGKRTVEEIGRALGEQFEDANPQLYDRLLIYLNHLEKNEHYIERLK
ncbi:MAG: PqqD family protein [Enterococcus sp.]